MAAAGVDCLFLTSEKNIRYLTGFHSQTWVSPTRPRYVLLPVEGEPVAVVPTSNVPGFRATTWLEDVRAWPAPRPADDGVSLVIDALRSLAGPRGRVAAEIGPEMRVEMPIADFLRIRETLPGPLLDAGPVIRPVRMVKSAPEIARMRRIAGIASEAFARLARELRPGLTERDVARVLHGLLVELGADTVPYLVPVSGAHGYEQINMGPTDRRLEAGDLLVIDVGATWRGYFCDFDRNFALGPRDRRDRGRPTRGSSRPPRPAWRPCGPGGRRPRCGARWRPWPIRPAARTPRSAGWGTASASTSPSRPPSRPTTRRSWRRGWSSPSSRASPCRAWPAWRAGSWCTRRTSS